MLDAINNTISRATGNFLNESMDLEKISNSELPADLAVTINSISSLKSMVKGCYKSKDGKFSCEIDSMKDFTGKDVTAIMKKTPRKFSIGTIGNKFYIHFAGTLTESLNLNEMNIALEKISEFDVPDPIYKAIEKIPSLSYMIDYYFQSKDGSIYAQTDPNKLIKVEDLTKLMMALKRKIYICTVKDHSYIFIELTADEIKK